MAAVPDRINYQGYLTDSSGMPVTGTGIPMKFRIFDVVTGSTDLWAEEQTVDVRSGIYDVVLGDGTTTNGTFDTALFAIQPLWLEVEVNGEIMEPRQKITSVAYAMQAGQADTLDGLDSTDFLGTGGCTMTGTLTLPPDGLVPGTNQLIISGGNVGIGTASPGSTLDVDGDINSNGVLMMDGTAVLEVDNSLYNTFLGYRAGEQNTTGSDNTFIGKNAGYSNTEGTNNTFIGNASGYSNMDGDNNVFLGHNAGTTEKGSDKLYIENSATTTPLIYGDFASNNVTINGDLEVTGGIKGYAKITGTTNITNGSNFTNRVAPLAIGAPSGTQLLFDGNQIEQANESTDIYINYVSNSDVILAYGGGKVGIGMAGGPTTALDVNGNARFRSIGSGASAGAVHRISDGTLTTSTSDRRLKTNIEDIENGLEIVEALQGVRFNWKEDPEGGSRIGLVAQDSEKVIPELTFTNPVDGYMGINYAEITAVLIEAVKEQQHQVDDQRQMIQEQQETIFTLIKRLDQLEKQSRP